MSDTTDTSGEDLTGLKNKNRELHGSIKDLQRQLDQLTADKEAAETDKERAAGDVSAVEKRWQAKYDKDMAAEKQRADAAVTARREDQLSAAISDAASKNNVLPEAVEALSYMAKAKHSFDGDNALVDGKPVADWFNDYVNADTGAWARRASENVGTGASGASGTKPPVTSDMTPESFTLGGFVAFAKEHGDAAANVLADKIGMPHLKV